MTGSIVVSGKVLCSFSKSTFIFLSEVCWVALLTWGKGVDLFLEDRLILVMGFHGPHIRSSDL